MPLQHRSLIYFQSGIQVMGIHFSNLAFESKNAGTSVPAKIRRELLNASALM